jgi:predicted transcriptional regulator
MSPLPNHHPKQLSLGPLETEILNIIWQLGSATVKDVHEKILADPDRELAYTSVTTVLRRLTQKGWLSCEKQGRAFCWKPLVSRQEAQVLKAHNQLNQFLAVGNPDVIAAFADSLDAASIDQIEAIALRLQAARKARQEKD